MNPLQERIHAHFEESIKVKQLAQQVLLMPLPKPRCCYLTHSPMMAKF